MRIQQLPFPKEGEVIDYKLPRQLFLEQWIIPRGTKVKLTTTINFGIVILPKQCVDMHGWVIPKQLFSY
jgi:hypothetical protein